MYNGIVAIGIKTRVKTEATLPNPISLRLLRNHTTPNTKATKLASAIGMPKKEGNDKLAIKNKPIPIVMPINNLFFLDMIGQFDGSWHRFYLVLVSN